MSKALRIERNDTSFLKITLSVVIAMILAICLNISSVFAATLDLGDSLPDKLGGYNKDAVYAEIIKEKLATIKRASDLDGLQGYSFNYGGKTYYVSNANWQKINDNAETIATTLSKQSGKDTDKIVSDMDDVITDMGVTPDTGTAATALSGFGKIISTVIGGLAIFITLCMALLSALDIVYIAFPPFRNFCGDQLEMGQNNAMVKKDNDGNLSLRWISDDAVAACKIATIESGKNKFAEYFKKRVWSYMILVILLFILLTGNITIFTNLALKAVNGVLKVIGAI